MIRSRSRPWRHIPKRADAGPLRCMFVITSMPVGGAETLLANMMRRIDPNVMRPELVCLKDAGTLGQSIAGEFPVHTNLLTGKWDIRVLPRLVRLMHKRRSDIVITVGAGDKMFWGRLAAHVAGVPVIASALHSTGWPDGVGRLNRILTPITDAFIAVADAHGQFLSEFEKFPKDKIHVIRNGIDCERFKPDPRTAEALRDELGLDDRALLIGIVAALRSEKNHEMLIRAATKVREQCPDAHWIIVGDGPERASIQQLVRDLRVADRVHLLGTRHDTERIVAALDVFALCSLNEASPVSILESLACGVPVVATDVGSVCESVLEGRTGHLVPSRDVNAFVTAVESLLADPQTRTRMGAAGRELVVNTGSLPAMVNGYQGLATRLYDRAANPRRSYGPAANQSGSWWGRVAQRFTLTPLRKSAGGK